MQKAISKSTLGAAFLFLLLPSVSCADTAYEIYAYGTGDFLATIFNGMAMHFADGSIGALVKLVLLLAFLSAMLGPILRLFGTQGADAGSDGLANLIKVALLGGIAAYALLIPKANVLIIDRISPAQTQVVANVPYVNAVTASMASRIGDVIGKKSETMFSTPDALKFTNGGLALGAKYMSLFGDIYPPSHDMTDITRGSMVATSLREYFSVCVFPTFAGISSEQNIAIAYDSIMKEYNIISHLKSVGYFNRKMCVVSPMENASSDDCGAGAKMCGEVILDIESKWLSVQNDWLKSIENKIAQNVGQAALADADHLQGVGALTRAVLNKYFPGSPVSPETTLRNIATIKVMQDAALAYIAMTGSPSAAGYHIASTRTTPSGWLVSAKLFNAIVHTMRALFEGIIYAFSVFLPVAFVAAGLKAITTYAKMTLWLQLWVPFYVILNLFADTELTKIFTNIANKDGIVAINFQTLSKAIEQSEMTLGYIGSFVWAVPALAWGVIKGGEYAMTHALSAATGGGRGAQTATMEGGRVTGRLDSSVGTGYGQAFSQGGMQARVADDSLVKNAHMGRVFQEAGKAMFAERTAQGLMARGVPKDEARQIGKEQAEKMHPQEARDEGYNALINQGTHRMINAAAILEGMGGANSSAVYHMAKGQGDSTGMKEQTRILSKAFGRDISEGEARALNVMGIHAKTDAGGRDLVEERGNQWNVKEGGGVEPIKLNTPNIGVNLSGTKNDALMNAVSSTLGSSNEWAKIAQTDSFKSKLSGAEQAVGSDISNKTSERVAQAISKEGQSQKYFDSATNNATGASVDVGAGLSSPIASARFTAHNKLEYTTKGGERFTAILNEKGTQELSKIAEETASETFRQYGKTEQGRKDVQGFLTKAGATQSAQVLRQGSSQLAVSESENMDAMGKITGNVADRLFSGVGGSRTMTGQSAAVHWINQIPVSGSSEDIQTFQEAKQETLGQMSKKFHGQFFQGHSQQMADGEGIEQNVKAAQRNIDSKTGPAGRNAGGANPAMPQQGNLTKPGGAQEAIDLQKGEIQKQRKEIPGSPLERGAQDFSNFGSKVANSVTPLTEGKVERAKETGQNWAEQQKSK